ncbi:flagellar protein FlaG [Litchfieldella xinjiangensis]|uniref:flagellar protein FlaG n=1 Tax=Litchfieldella xinjiangensis TaxID=1166948 RepID=UPI000693944E|nr:flagellar protein FlaG [Halomonas xinjiangensis]
MSELIYDISQATRGLSTQQRLDSMLAQLGSTQRPLPESDAEKPPAAQAITQSELSEPVARINEVMRNYGVEFHINEFDQRTITRIIDRESGEIIRQIPGEEVLRIAENLGELQGRLIRLEA